MMGMRRIALISEHASPVALLGGTDAGGQNVYVDEVSRHLAQQGYRIDVFTRRDSIALPEIIDWKPGVRVIHLAAGPAQNISKDEMWQYMPEFRDAFLEFIECTGTRYDIIHSNFWMSGWVALELRHILHIPVVHISHALGVTKRYYQGSADTSPGERINIEKQIIQNVDCVIASCPHEATELITYYGAEPARLRIIPLAVNIDNFYPIERSQARQRLQITEEDNIIVYVGRVLPRKDIRTVIRALPHLLGKYRGEEERSQIKLLVVGGETTDPDPQITPEIGVLQHLVAELGLTERVQFVGNRQPSLLPYYYSASDVVVTTPWYESFGLTPLEGMACARPVIGSNVGGIKHTILDGVTGLLVPPRSPRILAARLYYLLKYPELCKSMGHEGLKRVQGEFIWSIVAKRTIDIYEEVLLQPFQHYNLLNSISFSRFSSSSVYRRQ